MKIKNKLKNWIKRYWLSEVVSYSLAMWLSYITFKTTSNYYLSWTAIIIWDYLWYYWVMFVNEIRNSIKINKSYNLKLFLIDLRNLWFEFWLPQIFETFIIYPLVVFYVPTLFKNYQLWAFLSMTFVIMIFYIQTIILYEIRIKYFKN
jgi:hypothetical protein